MRPRYRIFPAEVLILVRDGKVKNAFDLKEAFGLNNIAPTDFSKFALLHDLEQIMQSFEKAGMIVRNEERIVTTEMIGRIQSALQLSLTELREIQAESRNVFVDLSLISELRRHTDARYDLAKLVRFCEELNSSFARANYIASLLLLRALLNHIPPIFGHTTFQQVVSQSAKSLKELLKPLEEVLRDVADLHTHAIIRHKENLPTENQLEPFKANVEVLLHEILVRLSATDRTAAGSSQVKS